MPCCGGEQVLDVNKDVKDEKKGTKRVNKIPYLIKDNYFSQKDLKPTASRTSFMV